jgi:hypothetical protein
MYVALTPASTLAGLEQFGSANSDMMDINTPRNEEKEGFSGHERARTYNTNGTI